MLGANANFDSRKHLHDLCSSSRVPVAVVRFESCIASGLAWTQKLEYGEQSIAFQVWKDPPYLADKVHDRQFHRPLESQVCDNVMRGVLTNVLTIVLAECMGDDRKCTPCILSHSLTFRISDLTFSSALDLKRCRSLIQCIHFAIERSTFPCKEVKISGSILQACYLNSYHLPVPLIVIQ